MALKLISNLSPVKRHRSERYVLISLVTFALTVVALRGILKLTGYVQIGNDSVHIAHVLWGGLGLFAATLLLLIVSNRWALVLGAVLSGGGVGLFIDEVGKFITRSNNYFTPVAAPIIYALFLATVLVYLRVRRPPGRDVRGEMYRALEQMSGVLDHEMSRHDLNELSSRLAQIQRSAKSEGTRRLAASMLAFVEEERPQIVEPQPGRTQRFFTRVRGWARRVFTRSRLRVFLIVALMVGGVFAVLDMALLLFLAVAPAWEATEFLRSLVSTGELAALSDKIWFTVRAVLEGGVGIALLGGAVLLLVQHERKGLSVAVAGLIVDLTAVNLVVFYEDQLKALIGIGLQYIVLVAAFSYRRIYLDVQAESTVPAEDAGQVHATAQAEFVEALREAVAEPAAFLRGAS